MWREAYVTEVHDKTCKMKILSCPNAGCYTKIQRQQISEHVSKCPHTVISCKYKGIGCDTELKREDMPAHEQDDKLHLHMALETVNIQQSAINQLRVNTNSQEDKVSWQKSDITRLQHTTKQQEDKIASQQSAISKLQHTTNLQGLKIALQQDEIALQQVAIRKLRHTNNSQQVVIDSLHTKVPRRNIFALSEYRRKKAATRLFQFPSFYTHPKGYHVELRVYANGHGTGEGTHVSVYVAMLEGEYDAELKWPFVGEITFTLLNQLADKNHCTADMVLGATRNTCVGAFWGIPKFIPHSALPRNQLKNFQYLKDDTLYFRVSVEDANYKHWLTD